MNGTTKAERRDARIFDEFAEVTRVLMHFFPGLPKSLIVWMILDAALVIIPRQYSL